MYTLGVFLEERVSKKGRSLGDGENDEDEEKLHAPVHPHSASAASTSPQSFAHSFDSLLSSNHYTFSCSLCLSAIYSIVRGTHRSIINTLQPWLLDLHKILAKVTQKVSLSEGAPGLHGSET